MSIRLRFVWCKDPVSWVVRGGQLGFRYSHVDVVNQDGKFVGAHHDGGVQVREPGYDHDRLVEETFFDIKSKPLLDMLFYEDLRLQVGKPYDTMALVDLALGSVVQKFRVSEPGQWKQPDRWFCSEMACALLEAHHVLPKLSEPVRRVTVRDLYMRVSGVTTPAKAS